MALDWITGIAAGVDALGGLFGGGGDAAPQPTFMNTPAPNLGPTDPLMQANALARAQAGQPYLDSMWRSSDFLHGMGGQGIGTMQTPQFIPGQGQSQFSAMHGGGYTQGWDPGIYAQGGGGFSGAMGGGIMSAGGANPIAGALAALLGLGGGLDVVKGGENMAANGGPRGQGRGAAGGNVQPKQGQQGLRAPDPGGRNTSTPAPAPQPQAAAPQQQGHPGVNIPPQYTPQGYQDMYGAAHPNPANLAAALQQWQHAKNTGFGQAPYNSGSAGYTPGVGVGVPGAYPGSLQAPPGTPPATMTQQPSMGMPGGLGRPW